MNLPLIVSLLRVAFTTTQRPIVATIDGHAYDDVTPIEGLMAPEEIIALHNLVYQYMPRLLAEERQLHDDLAEDLKDVQVAEALDKKFERLAGIQSKLEVILRWSLRACVEEESGYVLGRAGLTLEPNDEVVILPSGQLGIRKVPDEPGC